MENTTHKTTKPYYFICASSNGLVYISEYDTNKEMQETISNIVVSAGEEGQKDDIVFVSNAGDDK
jgi:hypothetical protein